MHGLNPCDHCCDYLLEVTVKNKYFKMESSFQTNILKYVPELGMPIKDYLIVDCMGPFKLPSASFDDAKCDILKLQSNGD